MRALNVLALSLRVAPWRKTRSQQVRWPQPPPRPSAIFNECDRQQCDSEFYTAAFRTHCPISTTHDRHQKIYNLFYIISSSWLNCVNPIIEMLLFILTVLRWGVDHVCIHSFVCVSVSMFPSLSLLALFSIVSSSHVMSYTFACCLSFGKMPYGVFRHRCFQMYITLIWSFMDIVIMYYGIFSIVFMFHIVKID